MIDRPILFSAPMIRAIIREIENPGTGKTETRRILKPQPRIRPEIADGFLVVYDGDRVAGRQRLRYAPGDRLWVRHRSDIFSVYFKPIPGWEGLYAAGTDGQIYRMDRGTPCPLSGTPSSKGYLTVSLSRSGGWTTYSVHRLVCEAFYGPPPFEDAQVRHLDGVKNNNTPENLDWGTQADNWQDRKSHGRGMGADHHAAKLSAADVEVIRVSAESQRVLATKFGVSQSTIGSVKNGQTWGTHLVGERRMPAFKMWKPSIHMPRWASRITLIVEVVKVERLQEISEESAMREGAAPVLVPPDGGGAPHVEGFRDIWTAINGAASWDANPWVAAIRFRPYLCNIDQMKNGA